MQKYRFVLKRRAENGYLFVELWGEAYESANSLAARAQPLFALYLAKHPELQALLQNERREVNE